MRAKLFFLSLFAGSILLLSATAQAVGPESSSASGLPLIGQVDAGQNAVISIKDSELYREIFRIQRNGHWGKADKLIGQLSSDILMGHVLYQRYMHPTAYRSSYKELHMWMKSYADHPGARRVYKLALRRHLDGWKAPTAPVSAPYRYLEPYRSSNRYVSPVRRSKAERRSVAAISRKIHQYLRRGAPTKALEYLNRKDIDRQLDAVETDYQRSRISAGYFYAGKFEDAYEQAERATRSRDNVIQADWYAGLAAWQLGDKELAANHFEKLAYSENADAWMRAAGGFWAARSAMQSGNPRPVVRLLSEASKYSRTFYGLIAARQLGLNPDFYWKMPELNPQYHQALSEIPGVRRAIALASAAQADLADKELRLVHARLGKDANDEILALAHDLQLAGTQFRLARHTEASAGERYDSAAYPVPAWEPIGGFTLDRALVFAFMRQESQFNATAKSAVGARGLMQLMPRTASFIGQDRSLHQRNGRDKLYDPAFNMALGQKYLNHLLETPDTGGSLFTMAAAYNGGPGNLNRWLRKMDHKNDPLMFIESVPSRETRIFIERVLSNYWIYRLRLKQPTPSLDAVAAGQWPVYVSIDPDVVALSANTGLSQ